ncbi:fluoride efflux transporter CrcB [Leptolyngbya iicbica]|nr:fluoride efflux transporter CrcB [Leptolyngbya sp. LK]
MNFESLVSFEGIAIMFEKAHIRAAIAVSLGAISGALCRHYLSAALSQRFGIAFPWGTLGVNLSGCLVMGWLIVVFVQRGPYKPEIGLMLTTGFLGAYTTFSTYELDMANLADRSYLSSSVIYGLGSPLLGLMCLALGRFMATYLWPRAARDRPSPDES